MKKVFFSRNHMELDMLRQREILISESSVYLLTVYASNTLTVIKVLKKINPFFTHNLIHYLLTAAYIGYNLQSSVINKAVTHTQFPMY